MTFIKCVWFNICYVDITCKYVLFFYENVLFNNILKGYLMPTENFWKLLYYAVPIFKSRVIKHATTNFLPLFYFWKKKREMEW